MTEFQRLLVIRSGAIGDFIVTLPVIHLLRQTYTTSWIAVVAGSRVGCLVKNVVDEFLDINGRALLPFFYENVDRSCEEYQYLNTFDLVVSYLGAGGQVSRNLLSLSKPRVINAEPLPPQTYDRHVTEFLLQPLSTIVAVASAPNPSVVLPPEEQVKAETFLSANGIDSSTPIIAVHPGSGSRRKVSPARRFCQAVHSIVTNIPTVRVLAIEGEADEENVAAFERGLKTPCLRVRREHLLELAAILSRASLFIGNDSGIAHLAAAVGVPSIVVFRASNPAVWAPRGNKVWVANDDSLLQTVERATSETLGAADQKWVGG